MLTKIKTPLTQDAFDLDPASQAALRLTDEVSWSFAVLFGRQGGRQVPIACDASGNLSISDASGALAELYGQLTGADTANSPLHFDSKTLSEWLKNIHNTVYNADVHLRSSNNELGITEYFDTVRASEPFYYAGTSIGNKLDEMIGLFNHFEQGTKSMHVTVDT